MTEIISDAVLERMDADGWTPTEVRRLIRSYRELVGRLEAQGRDLARVRRALKRKGSP